MPKMNTELKKSDTRELFRFARIKKPRIFDIKIRLQKTAAGKAVLRMGAKERISHARKFARSKDFIDGVDKLSEDYFSALVIETLPVRYLPSAGDIDSFEKYQSLRAENRDKIERDINNCLLSLYVSIILNKREQIELLTRLVQFLEIWPLLETVSERRPYAPLVLNRYKDRSLEASTRVESRLPVTDGDKDNDVSSSTDLILVWTAANRFRDTKISEIERKLKDVGKIRSTSQGAGKKRKKRPDSKKQTLKKASPPESPAIHSQPLKVTDLRKEMRKWRELDGYELAKTMVQDKTYMDSLGGVAAALKTAVETMATSESAKSSGRFCELYRRQMQKKKGVTRYDDQCEFRLNDPCLEKIAGEGRRIVGTDSIKPLGEAELVVVEERWMKYTPGEISSIETVLKNEKRARSVDVEKIIEQSLESFKEEITDNESESQATTSNDLKSEIQNELSSRFGSNINASASGSGGGSIGVVDFSGEGSLTSSVGIGIDTSMSSTETSSFSSEIVKRALEKTKTTTSERRISRTYNRYATNYTYEVDNTYASSKHINGVYVFLDKHICITERQYGVRQFLIADLMYPGRSLLQHEMKKQVVNLSDAGLPPVFDISPHDINEYNYLTLSGRYKAANVDPPPPLVKMLSTVYKTDASNESKEQGESKFQKVVDVLVPFFGKYKRFLIQDKLDIPEGYQVQEVRVTVTHGSNGISIPAHLPLTLGGALVYAMPKLMISSIPIYSLFYLPIALYEIMYLASPVMHYNADSSNVTVNIGHTTRESPYFFFQPEELIARISAILAEFPDFSEDEISQVKALINEFVTSFPTRINDTFDSGLLGPVNTLKDKLTELVDIIRIIAKPLYGAVPTGDEVGRVQAFFSTSLQDFLNALTSAELDFNTMLAPLGEFLQSLINVIGQDLLDAFRTELNNLMMLTENSDTLIFHDSRDFTGSLPVSFNCISLKPGITINLTACLIRIDDQALDAWRLQTHERLYAAYRQLAAEYETRLLMQSPSRAQYKSPGLLRDVEHQVIKERTIRVLKTLSVLPHSDITLDELKLFEHAVDWDNMSYRLYNYAPLGADLVYQKIGLYNGADERRKNFLNATWAQVLIPLKEEDVLESMMMAYMQSGQVSTLDELIDSGASPIGELDEITAIYRDIILRRQQLTEDPLERHRAEIVPTDLLLIFEAADQTALPRNEDALADFDGS